MSQTKKKENHNSMKDIDAIFDENIDLSILYHKKQMQVSQSCNAMIHDIRNNLNETLNIKNTSQFQGLKNKTKNFDSIFSDKRLTDIPLKQKKKKYPFSHTKNIFDKKVLLSKWFIKKVFLLSISIFFLICISAFSTKHFIESGYKRFLSFGELASPQENVTQVFECARRDFSFASLFIKPLLLIPSENVRNAYHIIEGGKELEELTQDIWSYLQNTLSLFESGTLNQKYLISEMEANKERWYNFSIFLGNILYHYSKVTSLGNESLQRQFDSGKAVLQFAYNTMNILSRNFDTFFSLLGKTGERRYLVLLQNNDEIRPNGGFIGSIGHVNILRGEITRFDFEDIYSYEWNINKVYTDKIPAPKGLDRITPTLGIRDANYKIHFPDSAKQVQFFADLIDDDIDGIVFLNQSFILDMLSVMSDIEMPIEHEGKQIVEKINEENFSQFISTAVEAKTFKIGTLGTPKKILFDFADLFIAKLKEEKNYVDYGNVFLKHINSRDFVVYSFHPEENSLLWKLGLTGEIPYSQTIDYMYPVYMSLGGGKTDRYYQRDYKKIVNTKLDCSFDTKVDITGFHLFRKEEEDKILSIMERYDIEDQNILFIQGKTENRAYLRILLPKEAQVKPNNDINIVPLESHTMVEIYTETRRLEKITHSFEYTLPNPDCLEYDFTLYKQPGIRNYGVKFEKDGETTEKTGIQEDYRYDEKFIPSPSS